MYKLVFFMLLIECYGMNQGFVISNDQKLTNLNSKIAHICELLEEAMDETSFMNFSKEAENAACNALAQYYRDKRKANFSNSNKSYEISMHNNITGFRAALYYRCMQEADLLKRRYDRICDSQSQSCFEELAYDIDLLEGALAPLFKKTINRN